MEGTKKFVNIEWIQVPYCLTIIESGMTLRSSSCLNPALLAMVTNLFSNLEYKEWFTAWPLRLRAVVWASLLSISAVMASNNSNQRLASAIEVFLCSSSPSKASRCFTEDGLIVSLIVGLRFVNK